MKFTALGIRNELTALLEQNGLSRATTVQQQAIPVVLSGKDVIVQAQTGTGKTLAFVLPILQTVNPAQASVQALIITPTRELAIQITSEIKKLVSAVDMNVLAAYGGQDVEAQIRKLKGASHIVVGTPGRLLDHLRRGTIDLSRVTKLVLDEADQMLAMGFLQEVEDIMRHTPSRRQTMLFSATIPEPIRVLAANYMRNSEDIRIAGKRVTLEEITQIVIETTDRGKQQALLQLIDQYRPFLAVIFCRTKIRTKKLTEAMQLHGLIADELHGDLSQAKREQVMKRFRDLKLQFLVATDVAARGLDIDGVTHVFNYDIPKDAESYIHRIGRTGRAGQKGMAVTLAAQRDLIVLQEIERKIGTRLERKRMNNENGEIVGKRDLRSVESKSGARSRNKNMHGKTDRGKSNRGTAKKDGRDRPTSAGRKNARGDSQGGTKRSGRDARANTKRNTRDSQGGTKRSAAGSQAKPKSGRRKSTGR